MRKSGSAGLFLDRYSPVSLLLALVVLIGMGFRYADFAVNERQGYRWCLENPVACDGKEIRLPVWDVVEVHEDHYKVFKTTGPIPVQGRTDALSVGDTVSIRTTFDASRGWLVEQEREIHVLRPWKKALSGLGVVLFFVGMPLCLRFKDGRLVLRG